MRTQRAELESFTAKASGNGSLTFFEKIAVPLAGRGWKVAPCFPKQKKVHGKICPRPLEMVSDSPVQIHQWAVQEPNANVCVYAQQVPGGLCFLHKDGEHDLRAAYERQTKKRFPKTLLVRSSVLDGNEKGHWYFLQSPRTMTFEKNITEEATNGWFSFRVKNEYVCSIGSIHPLTGQPYKVAEDFPIVPMPEDLLDWLQAQAIHKPKTREQVEQRGKLKKGTRYNALISEVGRLWACGYSRDLTIRTCLEWARDNFEMETAFDERLVRKEIEHVIDSYAPGKSASKMKEPPPEVRVSLKDYSMIKKEHLEYLWPKYLPLGKLAHFAGKSTEGKSPVSTSLGAICSNGSRWPDGTENTLGQRDVILLAAEDDPQDTVRPRLELAGANLERIHQAVCTVRTSQNESEKLLALSSDLALLIESMRTLPELALVIVDPLTNYLGPGVKMSREEEVRALLMPMALAAAELKICILTIGHFNRRDRGTESLDRIMGAAAFHGIARFLYLAGPDPQDDDPYAHCFVQRRGVGAPSLRYKTFMRDVEWDGKISGVIGVEWRGVSTATAEDAINCWNSFTTFGSNPIPNADLPRFYDVSTKTLVFFR